MDFMNLLRSAELLLYEVVSWLVFYPVTLWRCIIRPMEMMSYAERELKKPAEEQFSDALSPPIFLFLTLMIAHMAQTGLHQQQAVFQGVLGDFRNLLVFRAVAFSLFPLLVGLQNVRLAGQPLNRATLRPMFYSQCYVTVPFVLALDAALMLIGIQPDWMVLVALAILVGGLVWYFVALMHGFMTHPNVGRGRAVVQTILAFGLGSAAFGAVVTLALLTGQLSTSP